MQCHDATSKIKWWVELINHMRVCKRGHHKLDHGVECHNHARTQIPTTKRSDWSTKILCLHNSYVPDAQTPYLGVAYRARSRRSGPPLFEKILFICNTNCSRVSGWTPTPPPPPFLTKILPDPSLLKFQDYALNFLNSQ